MAVGGIQGSAEGIARRSRHRPDPPLHILQRIGSDWATWCTGYPALVEQTVKRRLCPVCRGLLRNYRDQAVEAGDLEAGAVIDYSWSV